MLSNCFFGGRLGVVASGSYFNHRFGSDNVEATWDRSESNTDFLTSLEIRKYDVQWVRRSGSLSFDYTLGEHSVITLRTLYNVRDDYENRYRIIYSGLEEPNAAGTTRGRVETETKGGADDDVKYARLERQTTTSNSLSREHLIERL